MKNTQKKVEKDKNQSSPKRVPMSTQLEQSNYSDMLAIRTLDKLLRKKKIKK